jgi:hypothetical protein
VLAWGILGCAVVLLDPGSCLSFNRPRQLGVSGAEEYPIVPVSKTHIQSLVVRPYPSATPQLVPLRKEMSSYLIFRMALEEQHIHDRQSIHITMSLELLPHLRPQRRHGHVQRVHILDLRSLFPHISNCLARRALLPPPTQCPIGQPGSNPYQRRSRAFGDNVRRGSTPGSSSTPAYARHSS